MAGVCMFRKQPVRQTVAANVSYVVQVFSQRTWPGLVVSPTARTNPRTRHHPDHACSRDLAGEQWQRRGLV